MKIVRYLINKLHPVVPGLIFNKIVDPADGVPYIYIDRIMLSLSCHPEEFVDSIFYLV